MPRTTESIVQAHRDATERRKAGKPIWDHDVQIKDLLDTDDLSPENVQKVGKQVADRLCNSPWLTAKPDGKEELTGIIEEFDDVEDEHHFGLVLDAMYDLADADRVWIK